jgi:hypothetical protein
VSSSRTETLRGRARALSGLTSSPLAGEVGANRREGAPKL